MVGIILIKTTAYEEITDFQTIYETYEKCRKKKRPTYGQIRFEMNLSSELVKLQNSLKDHTYRMSNVRKFLIKEPKPRWITVLPFQDKIVQKLLSANIFQPYLETHSIYDSAACQKGKGVTFAISRLTKHLRNYYKEHGNKGYFLKADIKNFYPSITVQNVKDTWLPQIEDENLAKLIQQLLDSHPKGVAMGNQLSTIFAVFYLDPIDRFIKEEYRLKYYTRYVDDFICIAETKQELHNLLMLMQPILQRLNLEFNEKKTMIIPMKNGVDYVGWHFYLNENGRVIRRMRKASKIKMKRKLKDLTWKVQHGIISQRDWILGTKGLESHLALQKARE